MLSEAVIKRLNLSRYLFELALQNLKTQQETADAACMHLLQDAVEVFFLAAFDHRNIRVASARTEFPQYLDKLSEALDYELPFRRRLLEINKVRVHSKHDGILPNSKEVRGYVTDARKFLEQTCEKVFQVDFWTISLIDLLDKGEQKILLKQAEENYKAGKYLECLISCRQAFFISFESEFDIQKDIKGAGGILFGSQAPYYARNQNYADEYVKTHFDYIVLDYASVDANLMKEGIDNMAFWNVRRLTPEVYRHDEKDKWRVKTDLQVEESEGIQGRASYVLSNVVSMLLTRQNSRRMLRSIPYATYSAKLKRAGVVVYAKADKSGDVAGTLRDDIESVQVSYATNGLNDDDIYWEMTCYGTKPFFMLSGFVLQDDLDFAE